MKKTFRTILAGAVALLAVSCYDDSDLRGQLGDLDERLDKVEATLNAETGGIADLLGRIETLEGKIAAIKVETDAETGLTTLTLSDGSSVALSKNGVLTIVDGGWATVAANGTVTPLGIKVAHPKLAFKVEGGELKVSYDGTTYEATGVKVSEYTAHVIGDVVVAEDGKSVTVTIGDKTLELPLVSSAVATLGLSRDSFFLRYEAEKVINITAENLSDIYVMNQPDGWNATVNDDELTITSPTKKAIEIGAARAEGLVLIHATDADGKCIVAKIAVETGKGLSVEINNGVLKFKNAYAAEEFDHWGESLGVKFTNFALGITPASSFESAERFIEGYLDYDPYGPGPVMPQYEASGFMYNYSNLDFKPFEEIVYETDVIEMPVEELIGWLMWNSEIFPNGIELGVEYVVWAAPVNERGEPDSSLLEYVKYVEIKVDAEVVNVTAFAASLNVDLAGAEKYFVGIADPARYGMPIEEYMAQASEWAYIVAGQVQYIESFLTDGSYSGETAIDLVELNYGPLSPNTTYYYYVLPYTEGVVYDDYESQCAPYIKSFTTAPLVPATSDNPVATPTIATSQGYTSVTVKITPAAGTYVYYAYVTSEELMEFENAAAKIDFLMEECYMPASAEEAGEATNSSMEPNSSVTLLYAVIAESGAYEVKEQAIYTLAAYPAEQNSSLTVTISDEEILSWMVSAKVTPTEGTTVYYKFMTASQLAEYENDQQLVNAVCAGNSLTAEKTISTYSTTATLVLVVVDADNKYNIVKKEFSAQ